jgi:hypothetical protein
MEEDGPTVQKNQKADQYRIDYSKWDRMVLESNSDEEEEEDDDELDEQQQHQQPRVTVLDQPTRITFGGNSGCTDHHHSLPNRIPSSTPPPPAAAAAAAVAPAISSSSSSYVQHKKRLLTKAPETRSEYGIPMSWMTRGAVILYNDDDAPKMRTTVV